MEAITTLLDDHHYIAGMLDVLEACASDLEHGGQLDASMRAGVRRYFEQFVPTHERKEEERLFPRLDRDLPAQERHLVEALRAEHRVLDALRSALIPHLSGTTSPALFSLSAAYIARKREHLRLEQALFHRAQGLPDDGLVEALEEIEREGLGPTGREWFTQVALDYTDIVSTWKAGTRKSPRSTRKKPEVRKDRR
jgi:hemerythrin-like domain-containing protein